MQLQLLSDTPPVSVYYDCSNDWLFVNWHGDLSLPLVQAGCLAIARCFLERSYPRILNNNADVTSMDVSAPDWLAEHFLPHLGLAGIEYLGWVCAPIPKVKYLTSQAVRQLRSPVVAIFDDVDEAFSWLQHTRFAHLEAAATADSAFERQAELASRVAELSERLRHYRKVARLSALSQRRA
ncbi:hypothetical protein GCM10022409_11340 [Hymenobacter glaciei]|uniref:STAS/SEC14 domain-containing protein n=1 Tax=Hymenobacter glaciei TaxID=877209 RepID=A0ABP7TNJ6_9BACT